MAKYVLKVFSPRQVLWSLVIAKLVLLLVVMAPTDALASCDFSWWSDDPDYCSLLGNQDCYVGCGGYPNNHMLLMAGGGCLCYCGDTCPY